MNSPLPFSIASPPFLRRYAEPSFPSHSSLHSLFPYNYFFLFFFFLPLPLIYYPSVFPVLSFCFSRSIFDQLRFSVLSPLLSSLPSFPFLSFLLPPSPFFSLLFSFPFFFFLSSSTITHCLFSPPRLRATLSLALFLSLHRSPSPSCCVFSSFFLL